MADFNFITGRLATGGAIQTPADVAALQAAGINAVINTRAEFNEKPLLDGKGIAYMWCPTNDDGQPKPPEYFRAAITFALSVLSQPHVKLLAHCQGGANRGPSMAYAVLRAFGIDAVEAEAMIRKARPCVTLAYKKDADAAVAAIGY